jgi:glycosyltransferase involved in cell wall biosynthesis
LDGHESATWDVLVVSPSLPAFDRAAGWLRLYLMLQMLARRYRVLLLARAEPGDPESLRYVRALEKFGIEVRTVPRLDVPDMLREVGLCVFFEFFMTAEQMLGRARLRRPDLPVVVDSVDVHFVRESRAARYAKRPWLAGLKSALTKRRELRVYDRADLILAATESDRAQILRNLPRARVVVIPSIHEVRDFAPGFEERRRNSVLFVGGFVHRPNVDAVSFFCREILPLVLEALPDLQVTIVGDRPPKEILDLQGSAVVVTGWVPEILPYLDSHCVGIAPLRFGAGIKGKIGEALAAGLPIVTTSVGAEGMDLEDGKTAMIADSPEGFAKGVVRICTDPTLHHRLSEEGRTHSRQRWGVSLIEDQLAEALESLRGLRPKPLSSRNRIGALVQDAYVRSGLARKVQRSGSVATWYVGRIVRAFGKG